MNYDENSQSRSSRRETYEMFEENNERTEGYCNTIAKAWKSLCTVENIHFET